MANVLVVEDDPTLAKLIAEVLSNDEHAVDVLNDGEEGARQLCSGQYALAVLDWDLPGKCGPDICRAYRESGGKSPVLMLTGRSKPTEIETGFDAGADDYLTKPFSLKEFRARVKALLRRTGEYQIPEAVSSAPVVTPKPPAPPAEQPAIKSCWVCGREFDLSYELCPDDGCNLVLAKADPLIGQILDDRYTVTERVARGGMGAIYKGHHERLRKPVAVKVLHSTVFFEDPAAIKRLGQEAVIVGRLNHPNIVSVYDFGVTPTGLPYLVMDFLDGITLGDVVKKDGPLTVDRAINLFLQIAGGMRAAHEAGLIHRDLKPSNIMLLNDSGNQELAKILDFGIAKVLPESGIDIEKLTQTGETLGTVFYMSPEQCSGGQLDYRSDIYSLGCVMYEALIGLPPFQSKNPLATIQLQVKGKPLPFNEARPDYSIPAELEAIVMKTLEKEPSKRHQSMSELRDDIRKLRS